MLRTSRPECRETRASYLPIRGNPGRDGMQIVMDLSSPDAVFSGSRERMERLLFTEFHELKIRRQFPADFGGVIGLAPIAQAPTGECRKHLGQGMRSGEPRYLPKRLADPEILDGFDQCRRVPIRFHRESRSARMAAAIRSGARGTASSIVKPPRRRVFATGTSPGLTIWNVMAS